MTRVFGIGGAAEPGRTGLAVADVAGDEILLWEALRGSRVPSVPSYIAQKAQGARRVLLALDAPLGWPLSLGTALQDHAAGAPVQVLPDDFFFRRTDRDLRGRVGRRSGGADAAFPARTAHAALEMLDAARRKLGQAVPLAWEPSFPERAAAIEVCPAATLLAHGLPAEGYRGDEGRAARGRLARDLERRMDVRGELGAAEQNAEVLDAVVCVLAAADFLAGRAAAPDGPSAGVARKEGWIWAAGRG